MKHIFFLSFALLVACSTSPMGRKQIMLFPESQMASLGIQAFSEMKQQTPKTNSSGTTAYVRCISEALLKAEGENPASWEIVVFDSPQLNAFALPGNKIGVYTGIMQAAQNQHQLAAVIGHEIAHVKAHHGNERMSASAVSIVGMQIAQIHLENKQDPNTQLILGALGLGLQFGVMLPYSRTHESEADLMGQETMARAGFNPEESIQLWKNMAAEAGAAPPEFLSTHPSSQTRISQLQKQLPKSMSLYQASSNKPQCTK